MIMCHVMQHFRTVQSAVIGIFPLIFFYFRPVIIIPREIGVRMIVMLNIDIIIYLENMHNLILIDEIRWG